MHIVDNGDKIKFVMFYENSFCQGMKRNIVLLSVTVVFRSQMLSALAESGVRELSRVRIMKIVLRLFLICGVAISLVFPGNATADADTKNVLVLSSYHLGFADVSNSIYENTLKKEGRNVEIYYEYLDTKRINKEGYYQSLKRFYADKLSDIKFDIIISTDDNALDFLLEYRIELFGDVPVVFGGINNRDMVSLDKLESYTGFLEIINITPTIDFALAIHPDTKKILVVHDASQTGIGIKNNVVSIENKYPELEFEYVSGKDYNTDEMLNVTANLSSDTIALLLIWVMDREGYYTTQEETASLISKASPVPLYCVTAPIIGHGPVGGSVHDYNAHIQAIVDYAARLLNGESISDLPVVAQAFNQHTVDYKQLARWKIDASKLPAGTLIINKQRSFYYMNRSAFMLVIGIVLFLTLSIILLLVYITLKRQMEHALRESELRYRLLFESSRDALNINSPDGRIIAANQAFLDLFSYTSDDIGKIYGVDIYKNPDDRPVILTKLLADGFIKDFPVTLKTKGGKAIDALCTASVRKDESGNPQLFYVNTHDVSERNRLESQLLQAQKMESIGRLAGGIAHDFNNILTAILGYTDFAIESSSESDSIFGDLLEIKTNSERAASLTRQLLAFSRRQMTMPQRLNLNESLKNMDKMLKRIIGEDVHFDTIFDDDLWIVYVDPGQVEQVLVNLVVNARDAVGKHGAITVETANVTFNELKQQDHYELIPGEYVMLAVSDNGSGMDEGTKEKIFEPFFTTKEVGAGTGLGLSTCYGIVKQNNGFIWVYSEQGSGSTFKVYFPRDIEHGHESLKSSTKAALRGGSETILIVEDEEAVKNMMIRTLTEFGYSVHHAPDGVDALRLLEHENLSPDILLTDVVMPKMGGQELHEKMLLHFPMLKTLFISGYTENVLTRRGLDQSMAEILQKPFTRDSLLLKIRTMLDS